MRRVLLLAVEVQVLQRGLKYEWRDYGRSEGMNNETLRLSKMRRHGAAMLSGTRQKIFSKFLKCVPRRCIRKIEDLKKPGFFLLKISLFQEKKTCSHQSNETHVLLLVEADWGHG